MVRSHLGVVSAKTILQCKKTRQAEEQEVNNRIYHRSPLKIEKSQPEGKRILPDMRFTEFSETDNSLFVLPVIMEPGKIVVL